MAPLHPIRLAALIALAGPLFSQETAPDVVRLPLDPDRGLAEAARERLRLVDPALDTWDVERWAPLVEHRLRALTLAWEGGPAPASWRELGWDETELAVAPLAPSELETTFAQGAWTIARARELGEETEHELPFAEAFTAWRDQFGSTARLDCEVFEVEAADGGLRSRIHLTAIGPTAGGRLQHNVRWTCLWRGREEPLELTALLVDAFESELLRGSEGGAFEDATQAAFGGEPCFAEQIAIPLDVWRLRLAAPLEPGSLGHHGLALGDADGDGLEDLYLCQPGGLPNRLLLRRSDGTLRDATLGSGADILDYSSSALLADFDGDGDGDLAVSTATALVFLANAGAARFEERIRIERSLATSLAAADFDDDGDLDVFACGYLSPFEKDGLPIPYHDARNGEPNALYVNGGGFDFRDGTADVGLDDNNDRFSFAAAWEDYDNDGDQDLYVANDFGRKNLYRNEGGRFRDVAGELGAEDVSAGMGVTWADVDGDGWMDLYATNMYTPAASRLTARGGFRPLAPASERAYRDHAMGNTLLLNRGGARFEDAAQSSGTGRGRWGWGAIFTELDNDGRPDLFAPNGFVTGEREGDLDSTFWRQVVLRSPEDNGQSSEDYAAGWRAVNRLVRQGWSWNGRERKVAFLNLGGGRFADVSGAAALDLADDARAAARVDWDADGDLDLLVTNRTAPMLRLLLNQQAGPNRWVALRLRGASASRTAVGARVTVETKQGRKLIQTLRCGEGYLAQSTADLHFGLGLEDVASVQVRWPGGSVEQFGALASERAWLLEQGAGRASPLERRMLSKLATAPFQPPPSTDTARTVVPVALPIPTLALESYDGQSASLLGTTVQGGRGTGKPLLLAVWDRSASASVAALRALAAGQQPLKAADIEVLALGAGSSAEDRAQEREVLREVGWPFAAACATPEAIQILELVQGALQDSARSLAVPTCFLVDPVGELIATYQGRVDPEQVARDVGLAALDAVELRSAAVPFAGRWIAAPPERFARQVAARLAEHGLERAAAEYGLLEIERRSLSEVAFKLQLGQELHQQGRLSEAIHHYRAALEIDPGHFAATCGLARSLHRSGALEEALSTYRRALALEPADAHMRCDLGLLHLAMADAEGARRELAALRSMNSDLAETLSQKIALFESGQR